MTGPTGPNPIPAGTKGATLVNDGSTYQPITNGAAVSLNTDANLAPKVADGHTFFVDATALASNRTIMPDATGAGECEGMTFIVEVATSGTGKSYSLVCSNLTLALTSKMIIECVCHSGAFQIGEWKPYVGTL